MEESHQPGEASPSPEELHLNLRQHQKEPEEQYGQHPLLMSTVVDNVLQFLQPTFLLHAGRVCRTWNALASSRLGRASWRVHLDPVQMRLLYMPLVSRAATETLAEISCGELPSTWVAPERRAAGARMQICLPVMLEPSASSLVELRSMLQLVNNPVTPFVASLELTFLASLAPPPSVTVGGLDYNLDALRRGAGPGHQECQNARAPPLAGDPDTFESGVTRLLESGANSLQELKLTFKIQDSHVGERDAMQAAFIRADGDTRLPPGTLMALKTLHVLCKSQLAGTLLIPILRALSQAAPHLERLIVEQSRISTEAETYRRTGPGGAELVFTVPSLRFMEEIQPPRLNLATNLRSLDIYIGRVNLYTRFDIADTEAAHSASYNQEGTARTHVHFPVLRELRFRCVQFGVYTTGPGLTSFVTRSCPALESLEVDDVTTMRPQGVIAPRVPGETLEKLARLSYKHPPQPTSGTSYNGAVLRLMTRCPYLTRVDTNFAALTTMVDLFTALGGVGPAAVPVIPARFRIEWPHVKTLHLAVHQFESLGHVADPPNAPLVTTMRFLMTHMYPNLDRLVISMGTHPPARQLELVYALALVFEPLPSRAADVEANADDVKDLDTMKIKPSPQPVSPALPPHVEINNLHHELTRSLTQMGTASWPWPDHRDVDPRARRERGTTTGLCSLTLRGVPRSLLRREIKFGTYLSQGRLDLPEFLSLVPRNCPNLVVRIDPELLMPSICPPAQVGPFGSGASEMLGAFRDSRARARANANLPQGAGIMPPMPMGTDEPQPQPPSQAYEQLLETVRIMDNPRVEIL